MINTSEIKMFAREARNQMISMVSVKLRYVLNTDSIELRVKENQINKLKEEIAKSSENEVIEKVAYTWFNRFMALRFMDANGYTVPKVVTPNESLLPPEIFQEAMAGRFSEDLHIDKERFFNIIDRKIVYNNPENEAYKMLLTAECNRLHRLMPFVFEAVDDYSEILLPEDLLGNNSIIAAIRKGMTDDDCQYEEVIGWIYQFYISEKKDEVFADLAKNKKITPENIPAATQLFTPHWIVRYMVENSLGKLWLESHHDSKLAKEMKYLVDSEQYSTNGKDITVKRLSPKEIRFLDPCSGSGHVLVYAFDLFAKMYEEEGYNQSDIPKLILENNLFGIDIDDRAAQLTHLALTMKARRYYPQYFRNPVEPNVIAMQNFDFEPALQSTAGEIEFTLTNKKASNPPSNLSIDFSQAKNFGSLIRVSKDQSEAINIEEGSIFVNDQIAMKKQAEFLARKYHCVVTNPPYMGGKGMNVELRAFVEKNYKDSKSDLMTCFMERIEDFTIDDCYFALINMPSWMFLGSFEELRKKLIRNNHIDSLLHMGRGIFGIDFGSVAFVVRKSKSIQKGSYFRLHQRTFQHIYYYHIEQLFLNAKNNKEFKYDYDEYRDDDGVSEIPSESNKFGDNLFFSNNQNSFDKIPGSPIAYWLSSKFVDVVSESSLIQEKYDVVAGISTGSNANYIFSWHEASFTSIWNGINLKEKDKPFKRHNKGGDLRKWYGNSNYIIKYNNNSIEELKILPGFRHDGERFYFKESISWAKISSTGNTFRYYPRGFCFDSTGPSIFSTNTDLMNIMSFLNTKVAQNLILMYNPTITTSPSVLKRMPNILGNSRCKNITLDNILISESDWDSRETSWDFKELRIASKQLRQIGKLSEIYEAWKKEVSKDFFTLHYNEEELNRIFIDIYGLKEEMTPEVELKDVTILQQELKRSKLSEVNSQIRHLTHEDTNISDEEREKIIAENSAYLTDEYFDKAEVVKQLISYSIGCMMGRYSLDKEGLILANQGETACDYLKQVPTPSFDVDLDGIIPILEEEFFEDDIVGRFKKFIKAVYGSEHFNENIRFIEDALGKDIRKYFVKDFYADHIKRYKKRPIYWLFSSPKKNFNALIYMHRYSTDMVSVLLNNYMREYKAKLETEFQHQQNISLNANSTPSEKIRADKEMPKITLILRELKEYEEKLYDAALQKTAIDLDDGVKVNYMKFKGLLYPISGLEKDGDQA